MGCARDIWGGSGLEGLGVLGRSTHKCISTQVPESFCGLRPTLRELTVGGDLMRHNQARGVLSWEEGHVGTGASVCSP